MSLKRHVAPLRFLIPEATDTTAIVLSAVDPARTAIVGHQALVPGVCYRVLRRGPPDAVDANVAVETIVVTDAARKA